MATKTISVDLFAYDCLCRLRREPRESFSKVIRRLAEGFGDPAVKAASSGTSVLSGLFTDADRIWLPPESTLERLDAHQASPRPRRDPRREGRAEDVG